MADLVFPLNVVAWAATAATVRAVAEAGPEMVR